MSILIWRGPVFACNTFTIACISFCVWGCRASLVLVDFGFIVVLSRTIASLHIFFTLNHFFFILYKQSLFEIFFFVSVHYTYKFFLYFFFWLLFILSHLENLFHFKWAFNFAKINGFVKRTWRTKVRARVRRTRDANNNGAINASIFFLVAKITIFMECSTWIWQSFMEMGYFIFLFLFYRNHQRQSKRMSVFRCSWITTRGYVWIW